MITKRGIIIVLTALLIFDTVVLARLVWLLNYGAEPNSPGVLEGYIRLVAFLSFPIVVISLAVILEIEGWRAFRQRRRQRPNVL